MPKSIWVIIIVVVLVLAGWGLTKAAQRTAPGGEDVSVFYPAQNREHIAEGSQPPGEYNSNPPSSGWHYGLTAKKQFYDEPVPDEYLLHNLEHGDIWIAYHPRIPEEVKKELERFAFAKINITPREANDADIALVAWERVDKFDLDGGSLPESRIRDFIKRYRNKGPERIPAGAREATFN